MYPDEEWDCIEISVNPTTTLQHIDGIDVDWDWYWDISYHDWLVFFLEGISKRSSQCLCQPKQSRVRGNHVLQCATITHCYWGRTTARSGPGFWFTKSVAFFTRSPNRFYFCGHRGRAGVLGCGHAFGFVWTYFVSSHLSGTKCHE